MLLGSLMIDLEGTKITPEEEELITHPQVGGLILFSRNVASQEQLMQLITEIRCLRHNLLIAVDQEGGRVQRLKDGVKQLPPMGSLGQCLAASDAIETTVIEQSKALGWLMAAEVLAFDIDFSFAPVLDRDYGRSQVIGDRAFGKDIHAIKTLAGAFMEGMHEAGMATTGKHFPGHGYVEADSHVAIPVDERPVQEIREQDMQAFVELAPLLDGIMPAHVIYPDADEKPAGFSRYWLQQVLRQEMGFEGVIFSDDLTMKGASVAGGYAERTDQALEAGCDMILVCNQRKAALEVLHHMDKLNLPANKQLGSMTRRKKWSHQKLKKSQDYQKAETVLASIVAANQTG